MKEEKNLMEEMLFRAPSKVIMAFDELETLMSLCLKSKVSYPTISHIIKRMKDLGIVEKNGRFTYKLTEKGIKMRDLMNGITKALNAIVKDVTVKAAREDADLQGGRNGRKKGKRK